MKWIYGKHDWNTMERGQENCFLLTDGLGGYCSFTMIGSVTRGDHALFMASVKAPNHRYCMIQRMKECLCVGEESIMLSSQEFADGSREEGYRYLSRFVYEDTPVWLYQAKGVEIRKEIGMLPGRVGLRYVIENRRGEACSLVLTPYFRFTKKGAAYQELPEVKRNGGKISSGGLSFFCRTTGDIESIVEEVEEYYYSYDACDERTACGKAKAEHCIVCFVGAGDVKELEIVYELAEGTESALEIIDGQKREQEKQVSLAGFSSEAAKQLVRSAAQFVAKRESTGGDTILAGFPFFEDWGRDTMIALPGLCISTGQTERAKSILRTFAAHERGGLMPNLFPEGKDAPKYNTADAALLFINCVYLYYEKTKEIEFVREMYPVMRRIIAGYRDGTEFGIYMDKDGLICAGEGLHQVTWMDVRFEDILPTARHGKPVEINAYWYNALRVMECLGEMVGDLDKAKYGEMANLARESFREAFWMEEKGYLKDVLSGTAADKQIRCNQIFAVSMPFSALEEEMERRIVDVVFEKLYTPYGLRTLSPEDKEFHPTYGGSHFERDMAYHQGTVWPFVLGSYYLAYLKVHHDSEKAREVVREELEVMESVLREGCIGQIAEIYDGENPTASRGCFAQAWSVGEMLRVYERLEKILGL